MQFGAPQGWPLPASLMIGFEVEVVSDELNIDPVELLEAQWFSREEIADVTTSTKISLSGQMIEAWMARP